MPERPNILFIMADDHAVNATSCYGSDINDTPNIDRIGDEGVRFENSFVTNSICAPSRATILTGKHSHLNGVKSFSDFDRDQQHVGKLLQEAGYKTAVIGKWHLQTKPSGFDYFKLLPGQGRYENPRFKEKGEEWQDGEEGGKEYEGYVTDLITDFSLDWIDRQADSSEPFFLMCHHKAPHRPWVPDEEHEDLYSKEEIHQPENFNDNYENRASAAAAAKMRIVEDLTERDLKGKPPPDLSGEELHNWKYQRYIKDYLRCVASIDDNVGRILDYLKERNLDDNTIVIYTSDQGFFLGEHGWFDKRFMYEESLQAPLIVRYPNEIAAGSVVDEISLNIDFAPTFLDFAGTDIPNDMQGHSLRPLLRGDTPEDWRDDFYYRYWLHLADHGVYAHYGLRTKRYKLIYYYAEALGTEGAIDEPKDPEWELFDLKKDPLEMNNVFDDPEYSEKVRELKEKLNRAKREAKDYE